MLLCEMMKKNSCECERNLRTFRMKGKVNLRVHQLIDMPATFVSFVVRYPIGYRANVTEAQVEVD